MEARKALGVMLLDSSNTNTRSWQPSEQKPQQGSVGILEAKGSAVLGPVAAKAGLRWQTMAQSTSAHFLCVEIIDQIVDSFVVIWRWSMGRMEVSVWCPVINSHCLHLKMILNFVFVKKKAICRRFREQRMSPPPPPPPPANR